MNEITLHAYVRAEQWVEDLAAALAERRDDQSGQGMVEYGLILGLVGVASVLVLRTLGTNIAATFSAISAQLGS